MPKGSKINKNQKKGKVDRNDKTKKRAEHKANESSEATKSDFKVEPGTEIIIPKDDDPKIQRGLYNDEILPIVEKLASQGLNNNQIAEGLGIGNRTFYDWMKMYPQFSQSIKKYRGVCDIMVENALYKNAIGFEYLEIQHERKRVGKDPDTGEWLYELVPTLTTNKIVPGNSTAQIFYLKNRMPHRYKDKVHTELSLAADISQMAFVIKRREE